MEREFFYRSQLERPILCSCYYDENLEPGIRFGPIIRDTYVIECNIAGYGSAIINGREFPVRPGDCYILLPGDIVTHTASFENPRCGVTCVMDGLEVGKAIAQAGITSEQPYAPAELFNELTAIVKEMVKLRNHTDPGADLRRIGLIYSFLGCLLRNSGPRVSSDWLSRIIGYVEANYYLPITVADLAEEACLERSYFSVRFKAETGQSPHAYLTALRIRKACTLMIQTRSSIAKTALLVGLDPRNFSRLFKKEMGMTPKEYLRTKLSSEKP